MTAPFAGGLREPSMFTRASERVITKREITQLAHMAQSQVETCMHEFLTIFDER